MKILRILRLAGLLEVAAAGWAASAGDSGPPGEWVYSGACDASAAVAVDDRHFLAATDEDSVLRLYRRDQPGLPIKTFDLTAALELGRKAGETDLEGAARIGDVAYWITSHSRDGDGREHAARARFFGTQLSGAGPELTLEVIGRPCQTLLAELLTSPLAARYDLATAMARAGKDKGGLNIEGLAADGRGGLLIGFRNPLPRQRALLIPLRNPARVIAGDRPAFGEPIELDLGRRGVRDLVFAEGRFLILAGPRSGADDFALFAWQGPGAPPAFLGRRFTDGFAPESAVLYPDSGWRAVQLLSDDSGQTVGGVKCKDLQDATQRRFRARWVELPGR
jgi:hypothetical protein